MEMAGLLVGILGLIGLTPVVYFIYDRHIRKRHSIDFGVGNIGLVRVISANQHHDEKLALVISSLSLTNFNADPITLKEVTLR